MKIGKVEFAPDYKSKLDAAMHEGAKMAEGILDTLKQSDERERLRDEVIEAALLWSPKRSVHETHHTARMCPTCAAERTFHSAVKALESFEAEQKK